MKWLCLGVMKLRCKKKSLYKNAKVVHKLNKHTTILLCQFLVAQVTSNLKHWAQQTLVAIYINQWIID